MKNVSIPWEALWYTDIIYIIYSFPWCTWCNNNGTIIIDKNNHTTSFRKPRNGIDKSNCSTLNIFISLIMVYAHSDFNLLKFLSVFRMGFGSYLKAFLTNVLSACSTVKHLNVFHMLSNRVRCVTAMAALFLILSFNVFHMHNIFFLTRFYRFMSIMY